MSTGTFVGRFRHNDAASTARRVDSTQSQASCTCNHDEGIEPDPTEEEKRRREGKPLENQPEETELERAQREAEEARSISSVPEASHTPPSHPHRPGEAYGIQQNTGLDHFIAASDRMRKPATRRAPTADELARMTPTQRFAALSAYRHGRR